MNRRNDILDILIRKLDRIINPQIENLVIYSILTTGISLVGITSIFTYIGTLAVETKGFSFWVQISNQPELVIILIGFILICIACILLYIFKIYGRTTLVIESPSDLSKSWKHLKYSFFREEFINPLIINDLIGWLSDTGQQIVSVNIDKSNKSNRYFGEIETKTIDGGVVIEATDGEESFTYHYIGTSNSGIHILHTTYSGGGSGVFHTIALVTIEQDSGINFENDTLIKTSRLLLRIIGSIGIGDRYGGKISYKNNILSIGIDKKHFGETVIKNKISLIIK